MDQTESQKTAKRLDQVLREFTDGAFLVAFDTGGHIIIVSQPKDTKTQLALNSIVAGIVAQGGVGSVVPCNPPVD